MLRNGIINIKKIVKRAFDLSLPQQVGQAVQHMYLGEHLPHGSVQSRFKVIMDAGLMAMRDVHKSRNGAGVLRAFLSDSSPQGTQNWQLSEYWETGSPLEVSDYVDEMADLMDIALLPEDERAEQFPDMSHADIMDRHKQLTQECHGLFSWHMLPPTALGFRSQGHFHKLNAVLHSLYNESHSFHDLRAFLRTVCSITTDLGVEKGLGDASNKDLAILLQQFVDLQYMDPDDDAELDEDTRPAEQEFLFEECLSILGICHLIHNCAKHLTSALPNFKSFFFNAFKDAVNLLRSQDLSSAGTSL